MEQEKSVSKSKAQNIFFEEEAKKITEKNEKNIFFKYSSQIK